MSHAYAPRMTAEEFLDWCLDKEGRWELVNGEPILAMAGATKNHDRVTVNLLGELRSRLRGGPWFPTSDDIAARMRSGNIRRPDVTIDCGQGDPGDVESREPTVFFEVLSPSTRAVDFIIKAEEYKVVPSLKHFVLIEADRPTAHRFTRGPDGWTSDKVEGLDGELLLEGVPVSLPMAEIYDGVQLEPPKTRPPQA